MTGAPFGRSLSLWRRDEPTATRRRSVVGRRPDRRHRRRQEHGAGAASREAGRAHPLGRRGGARALRAARGRRRSAGRALRPRGARRTAASVDRARAGRGGARAAGASCAGWRSSPIRWWPRRSRGASRRRRPGRVVVCEVPLLFEAGYERPVRPGRHRRGRARSRGGGAPSHALRPGAVRASSRRLQASSERRVAGSDLAFFNDGDCRATCARSCGEAYDTARGAGSRQRPMSAAGCGARRAGRSAETAPAAPPRRRWLIAASWRVAGGRWSWCVVAVAASPGGWWCPASRRRSIPSTTRTRSPRWPSKYGLDPYLVAAVVTTESGFDPEAVSRAGAVGLMQLMPDTAEWVTGLDSWKGADEPGPHRSRRTAWSWAPATWPICCDRSTATPGWRWPPTTPGQGTVGELGRGGGRRGVLRTATTSRSRDPGVRASGWSTAQDALSEKAHPRRRSRDAPAVSGG